MRIFVAGAAGAIGRQLVPMLVAAGHEVTGTTRSPERAAWLREAGAAPAVVDASAVGALSDALREARPEVVINQLTDLAAGFGTEQLVSTGRLRRLGTRALVDGALDIGARRLISQSGAWRYADGPLPHDETQPLDTPGDRPEDDSLRGMIELERLTLETDGLDGVVLRYGFFHGPGTSYGQQDAPRPRIGVVDAARATVLAITGPPGIYNVVEDDPEVSNLRARALLGWEPELNDRP